MHTVWRIKLFSVIIYLSPDLYCYTSEYDERETRCFPPFLLEQIRDKFVTFTSTLIRVPLVPTHPAHILTQAVLCCLTCIRLLEEHI